MLMPLTVATQLLSSWDRQLLELPSPQELGILRYKKDGFLRYMNNRILRYKKDGFLRYMNNGILVY